MSRREAFVMQLKKGYEQEYERRHRDIWPEVVALLHEAGVHDYSIYLVPGTLQLFAYQETDGDGGSQDLGSTAVIQKWWAYMADIMETNPDNSPVSIPLPEVFHMA